MNWLEKYYTVIFMMVVAKMAMLASALLIFIPGQRTAAGVAGSIWAIALFATVVLTMREAASVMSKHTDE